MHEKLNGETLEEVDCFNFLGSQVAEDGGRERAVVHIMNEGYIEHAGAPKSELNNRCLLVNVKKCLYEGVMYQRRCTEQRHRVCELC